jgi:hypothetical protein
MYIFPITKLRTGTLHGNLIHRNVGWNTMLTLLYRQVLFGENWMQIYSQVLKKPGDVTYFLEPSRLYF